MRDLQKTAEDYLKAHLRYKAALVKMEEAEEAVRATHKVVFSIGGELTKSIGRNIPRRVFKVGDNRVLIVDYREEHDNMITIDSFQ